MKANSSIHPAAGALARLRAGFSIIEMMVAVALLGIVILALYSLFDQTQKALRTATGQADVNEPVRAALDILTADLQRAAATGIPDVTNMVVRYFTDQNGADPAPLPPWLELVGPRRQAFHEILYFQREQDHSWRAAGFFVGPEFTEVAGYKSETPWPPPVGSLYAYTDPDTIRARRQNLSLSVNNEFNVRTLQRFNNTSTRTTSASRVLDGVVVFRVLPYDSYGRLLDEFNLVRVMGLGITNGIYQPGILVSPATTVNLTGAGGSYPARMVTFLHDQVPASVEIELGVLDPKTLEAYRSVRDAGTETALAFLERNQSRIQMFRRRIQLRTAPRSLQP